jgi:DNA-binding NarL/FixJ family response regulator
MEMAYTLTLSARLQDLEEEKEVAVGNEAMNPRTKIFVVEQDCGKLINIMLFLEQFPEFDLVGSGAKACELNWQLQQSNVDVILIDSEAQDADSFATIRTIKASSSSPAVLVLCGNEQTAAEKILLAEADAFIRRNSAIKDLAELIRRTYNRRKTAVCAANVPLTRAG